MTLLLIQAHLAYLGAVEHLTGAPQRLRDALAERDRGDGGPIPTAVIITAVLAAALVLAALVAKAVQNHSKGSSSSGCEERDGCAGAVRGIGDRSSWRSWCRRC